ncbi:hypothetical protein [Georgenia deserti]|uniref:Uncharacterized protein n=1 Tax=Georgenia deserti TaxID=2093781 RepID=A0ABW4L518_9MICO
MPRVVRGRVMLAVLVGAAAGLALFLWFRAADADGAVGDTATASVETPAEAPDDPVSGSTPGGTGSTADDETGGAGGDGGIGGRGDTGGQSEARGSGDAEDGDGAGANSPGIEMAPDADRSERPPGAVGPLPRTPALDVPEGPDAPESAVDALVDNFPTQLIDVAASSTVLSSSVSSDGHRLHVSVEATDTRSVAEVMERYTSALRELGFTATPANATAGSTATSYSRDGHSVVVSARPQTGGTRFTVVGSFDETS